MFALKDCRRVRTSEDDGGSSSCNHRHNRGVHLDLLAGAQLAIRVLGRSRDGDQTSATS
jgi:hypothetical protein